MGLYFFFFKSKFDIDQNVHFSRNWLELDGMAGTSLNWLEFDPRWNGWYYRTGLHADTRYFGHSGWNGTKLITLVISKANHHS